MKKNCFFAIILTSTLVLGGCASNNVKRFIPDPLHKTTVEKHLTKSISVDVRMPKGDSDAIMCRMVGNIYLPGKMTYSKYIEDAFKKVLASANRLSSEKISSRNLEVSLTEVDFSSTSGEWYINANVKAGSKHSLNIKSSTKFGTSWIAEYACKNVAESFDDAVNNFINEVLTNNEIIRNLGK